jgi:serine protease Do
MGITVQELTEEIAQRLGYEGERGVIISSVNPDGPAAKLDDPLRRGDLIMEIEDKKIENMQDYKKAIKEVNKAMEEKGEKSVMLYLKRSSTGQIWFAVLKKEG